ncbi:MAG: BatA domain-containing protein [Planctomycetaceae bacterium]
MTFLQPLILFAIPLIALPIVIHLVNQNRHRSISWAATMFLIQAQKMVTGMRKLKYWLILAARTLAMIGLVFALSRPMSGGWLGLTVGGAPDTTIVVLDRSVSMEQTDPVTGKSRRESAVTRLVDLIQTASTGTQLVLIDSATGQPIKVESPGDLIDLPETQATTTSADIPSLVQAAAEYLTTNQTGRADIWVCSDLQQSDWNPNGGRWDAVRELLKKRDGAKLYLLNYQPSNERNLSVSVSNVHRRETTAGAELVMDITVQRTGDIRQPETVPLAMVIDGARSTLDLKITGGQGIQSGHAISLDAESKRGWGRIELPADSNPADNVFDFVYAEPAVQNTVIVSDNETVAEYLRIAAATPSNPSLSYDATVLTSAQTVAIPWETAGLIVWQAPLPTGEVAERLQQFVASGRSVLFFPSEETDLPGDPSVFGCQWGNWIDAESSSESAVAEFSVSRWRVETDLLSNSQAGTPLPLGSLRVFRYRQLTGSSVAQLADLSDGGLLVARALDENGGERGAAWFCSTLPLESHSTLVRNGVVFYVMLQRSLAQGAAALGAARQMECNASLAAVVDDWQPLDEVSRNRLLSQRSIAPGLYRNKDDILLALNRPLSEDSMEVIDDAQLDRMLGDVGYTRIDDAAGNQASLASEIWRAFLCLMIFALLAEALLCVPEKTSPATSRMVA